MEKRKELGSDPTKKAQIGNLNGLTKNNARNFKPHGVSNDYLIYISISFYI